MRIDAHPMRIGRCIRMANPNKNPPIVVTVLEYDFSGVVLGGRIILSIFTQIRMILLMEMRHVHGGFELRLGIH